LKALDLSLLGLRILAEAPVRPRWAYYRLRTYAYHYLLNDRHRTRMEEYRAGARTVHEAVAHVLGRSDEEVAAADDSELLANIEVSGKWVIGLGAYGDGATTPQGPIGVNFGPSPEFMRLANLVCRLVEPETVIETGVGRGFMTSSILDALARNQRGHLWSIDLPGLYAGYAEQLGEAIPARLRERWTLEFGPSAIVLPRLLAQLDQLDVSVHDAAANYDNQSTEFALALGKMRPGGVLISNMINSDAFIEATDRIDCRWAVIDHHHPNKPNPLGVLCKLS
jgi:predicted O-methyltransferase YrrM